MLRRFSWTLLVLPLIIALAACAGQQTTPEAGKTDTGAAKSGDIKLQQPQSIPGKQDPGTAPVAKPAQPGGSPVAKSAASPVPKTAASPAPAAKTAASPVAAARPNVTPQGSATYVWHTAISPAWFDPQENPALITPYAFDYALHDAVIKHMPGKPLTPSLAESYEIAPDYRSATIKLRDGIKFHNGEPVTSADVKFTYENYKGANANVLKEKTASIETPDARTVKFNFKEPFLDFLILYGSPASGAAWVVPAKYYQEVGPDGFKQNPIGAGPYKFVSFSGNDLKLEAFEDYWRHAPYIKDLTIRSIPEGSTRLASLQAGEIDFMNLIPGELIDTAKADPNIEIAGVQTSPFWIQFPGYNDPNNPFNNAKVREAVSLALDRRAISEAEEGGLSGFEGNFIPADWPGALQRPMPEHNLERAQQLMQEAGYPNGFDAGQITPLPNYFSLAERIGTALRQIGITTSLNQMERAAFADKLSQGAEGFNNSGIVVNISGAPGDAAGRIRSFAICQPAGASSVICDQEIDEKFAKYEASTDPQEREKLLNEIQAKLLDEFIFIPVYRQALVNAQGPKVENPKEEVWGSIPQYVYVGPYEEVKIKQ